MGFLYCCSISVIFKLIESLLVFTCLMLHRVGYKKGQVFFAAANDLQLDNYDTIYPAEADSEILGAGAVMAFCIITPMMLISYTRSHRTLVQATSLDALFSLVGGLTLIAAGAMSCFAWNNANENNIMLKRSLMEVAGALGIMTTITGVIYMVDFAILVNIHLNLS